MQCKKEVKSLKYKLEKLKTLGINHTLKPVNAPEETLVTLVSDNTSEQEKPVAKTPQKKRKTKSVENLTPQKKSQTKVLADKKVERKKKTQNPEKADAAKNKLSKKTQPFEKKVLRSKSATLK